MISALALSPKTLRRSAAGVFTLITVLYVSTLFLVREMPNGLVEVAFYGVWLFAFSVVGLVVALRIPDNRIAWLCLAFGMVWAPWITVEAAVGLDPAAGTIPYLDYLFAVTYPLWVPGVAVIALLLLVFPDGHLPSRGWRHLLRVLGFSCLILFVTGFILPGDYNGETAWTNPLGVAAIENWRGFLNSLVVVLAGCLLGAGASVVVRFRRAAGLERLQLKWLVGAGVVSALVYLPLLFLSSGVPVQLVWALIPLAVGVSILRYRLFEIDRLISRTVAYILVAGFLAAVYVSVATLLGTILAAGSDLAVAASTLVAAVLFNPVRRRLAAAVDRRFNRSRYRAEVVALDFSDRLRHRLDADEIAADLLSVANKTMQPAAVSLWIRRQQPVAGG